MIAARKIAMMVSTRVKAETEARRDVDLEAELRDGL
jgi:hypothetical protein